MRTDVAIDKLIDISPIIFDIRKKMSANNEFVEFMKEYNVQKGGNIDFILKFIPKLLKICKDEIFAILAIINEVSEEEIRSQSVVTTINQIKDLIKDEDIRSFFSSAITTDED